MGTASGRNREGNFVSSGSSTRIFLVEFDERDVVVVFELGREVSDDDEESGEDASSSSSDEGESRTIMSSSSSSKDTTDSIGAESKLSTVLFAANLFASTSALSKGAVNSHHFPVKKVSRKALKKGGDSSPQEIFLKKLLE